MRKRKSGGPAATYTGIGYLMGVPARDLTAAELAQHRTAIEAANAASVLPLYVIDDYISPASGEPAGDERPGEDA